MAKRKIATKAEKDMIARFVHAFIVSEIGKDVIAKQYPEHAKSYYEFMRKEFPEGFRLLDEFHKAVPRIRKQVLKEFQEHKGDENA